MPNTISLAMIVKNEQNYLDRCLKSVAGMVDELVVVDTGSTDRTKEIALSNGALVFDFEWCGDFSAARNYAIEHTTGDWVLILDADEYFTEDCGALMRDFVQNGNRIGRFKVISRFDQDGQIHYSEDDSPRLFPRDIRYAGMIHEQVDSSLPRHDINASFYHDGYYMTDKSERNLALLHRALEVSPNDPYLLYQIGKQYRGAGNNTEAEAYLARCYQLLSKHNAIYVIKAKIEWIEVLTNIHKYEQAFNIVEKEAGHLQDSPDFHFAVAVLYLEFALNTGSFQQGILAQIEHSYLTCLELGQRGAKEIVNGSSTYLAAYNLAVYYETTGSLDHAKHYYQYASSHGYEPAKQRLRQFA
ncbi:glycosyltransferase family 2 protein [Paenibacillus lycopersici]|nr:glycosyltransferase family 2 protein [Paenibacillus lycopersici]